MTSEAFAVADELLGRKLAAPWRRGLALSVDLLLVLALTRTGGLVFSILVGAATFWLIVRRAKNWRRGLLRSVFALPVALLVFSLGLALAGDAHFYGPSFEDWKQFGESMGSSDPKLQEAALLEIEERYRESVPALESRAGQELPDDFRGGTEPETPPLAELDPDEITRISEALDAVALAVRARDSEALARHLPDVERWLSERERGRWRAERRQMVRDYAEVTRENQGLRDRLEHPSLGHLAGAVAGSLGLTLGWTGVYFTLFPAFWGGRTPGKFLLGTRIVRLDGRPLSAWAAFERFAGYAAGLATGLLGFLQIFWDANRQGLHDKIVGTVVVRNADPR